MKRKLLSIMLVVAAAGTATAQEVTTTTTVSTQDAVTVVSDSSILKASTACAFTPVSHWSIGLKGGGNYFRVAPGSVSRSDQFHWVGGAAIEYSINPLVGLGVEYMYNPYGHTYQLNANQLGTMEGRTHDVLMFASINLMNLLVPNRTNFWSKMNIYGDAGVGIGFYQYKLMDAANNVIVDSRDAGDGVPETVMGKLGLNLEYNISKSIALGGEVQYRYYDRTNLGGYQMSKGNSDALTATIGLRFKLGATGQKQHARNISMCEYYPKPAPVIINKIVKDNTVETMDRLKAIEAENAALNDKVNKLNNHIDSLSVTKNEGVNETYENIEFEFGSDKLTQGSYRALDEIATTLKNNKSTVRLNVAGYTDYIGTDEFNQTLSVKRGNAVKRYLLSKNVPSSSVTVVGYGEKNPIGPNNTSEGRQLNRRVEFQLTK
jgi:outer membrane protein OmpA-like peptidoglycan-associated protein/opacity protein-like surface antigen